MPAGHLHDSGQAQSCAEAGMPGELAVGHGDVFGAVEIRLGDGQVPEALQFKFVRQRLARVWASQIVGVHAAVSPARSDLAVVLVIQAFKVDLLYGFTTGLDIKFQVEALQSSPDRAVAVVDLFNDLGGGLASRQRADQELLDLGEGVGLVARCGLVG